MNIETVKDALVKLKQLPSSEWTPKTAESLYAILISLEKIIQEINEPTECSCGLCKLSVKR